MGTYDAEPDRLSSDERGQNIEKKATMLIEIAYKKCENMFTTLYDRSIASFKGDYGVSLKREATRFTKWAQNVGAHRSDRMSLEYRLRNASSIKQEVLDLIQDLSRALCESSSRDVVYSCLAYANRNF